MLGMTAEEGNGLDERPVGVFDSSVGGISVLRELTRLMPHERFLYYGDSKNAPYGVRPEKEIEALTIQAADWFLQRDVKALVIACNTATSAAAPALRKRLSIPVIGMEPALKPAAVNHKSGAILVMATPATLKQSKFQRLLGQYGEDVRMVPCGGLMEFVERLELDSPALDEFLRQRLTGLGQPVESVVLGCTHYVFLKKAIRKVLPDVALYDGNLGTARQLRNLLLERGALRETGAGGILLNTSGDGDEMIGIMKRLYEAGID